MPQAFDFYTDFPFAPLDTQREFTARAEQAGYTGIWAAENHHDPFLPIAASAHRKLALSLGTGVTAVLARNPFTVAQMAWDLHFNTGEQFILGINTHLDVHLAARFGIDPEDKHERLVDLVLTIREIWASWLEDRGPDRRGPYFSIHACPPGYRPTTSLATLPKIYLLCATERDVEIAPRCADGIFTHPMWTPAYIERFVWPELASWDAQLLERNGKGVPIVDGSIIVTGDDEAGLSASREQARQRLVQYWMQSGYDGVFEKLGFLELFRALRERRAAGEVAWWPELDRAYHSFVCDARLAELATQLKQQRSARVTGLFPNIMSDIPRILPAEIVGAIRNPSSVDPGSAARAALVEARSVRGVKEGVDSTP